MIRSYTIIRMSSYEMSFASLHVSLVDKVAVDFLSTSTPVWTGLYVGRALFFDSPGGASQQLATVGVSWMFRHARRPTGLSQIR